MREALKYLRSVEIFDTRQRGKVLHKLIDTIGISFFAMLTNADDSIDIQHFGQANEEFLREYFEFFYICVFKFRIVIYKNLAVYII